MPRPAILSAFPARRPAAYSEEKTAVLRPVNGGPLAWADIARDRIMSRPSEDRTVARPTAPVVRLAPPVAPVTSSPAPVLPAASKAPRARKARPVVPVYLKPSHPWMRGGEAFCGAAFREWYFTNDHGVKMGQPLPASVSAILKRAEWKGSVVTSETGPGEVPTGPIGHVGAMGKAPQPLHGPHPRPPDREWIVLTHPSGATLRLDASKLG